ncbi:MAG: chondroitinase family protein, partial [bacterium]
MTPENIKISEDFEGAAIPAGWRVDDGGAMRLSPRHYKDGKQSLQWTWTHGSRLIREGLSISTAQHPQAGMSGWVYCEKPVDGRLTFRLGTKAQLAAGTAAYQFRFGLNFTGWRMFQIQFEVDARTPTPGDRVEMLEIAPSDAVPAGCLYLDAFTLLPAMAGDRSAD